MAVDEASECDISGLTHMNGHTPIAQRLKDPDLIRTDAYIDGAWAPSEKRFPVEDPASGILLGQVANLTSRQVETAIQAAELAFGTWSRKTARERHEVMMRWFRLILEHAEDLACLMTSEQGKPMSEARGEVAYAASFVEWFAEEGKRIYGETIPTVDPSKRYLVLRQPIGVCAAITPWNFPIAMITRKVAPAIAAGCTVLIKPAEQTPLSALALAELAHRAGFPRGVLNVLTANAAGSIEIGRLLCSSNSVRHLSFTGSTEVGRLLMAQCAPSIKKLSLELGGNAPFIVFDDADLSSAVEGAISSKYRNAGQTCVCANRIYVQAGVYEEFLHRLAARVDKMTIGHGLEPGVQQGPLIDDQALLKVKAHVEDAIARGARLITGGRHAYGRFYQPTVLADVTHDMLCAREETFGPVAPVFRFEEEADAIRYANSTEFGLASYFYSRDIGRVIRVAEALESGMVGVNTGQIGAAEVPFGGVKQSGIGREGSRHGIEEYVELKYLCLGDIKS